MWFLWTLNTMFTFFYDSAPPAEVNRLTRVSVPSNHRLAKRAQFCFLYFKFRGAGSVCVCVCVGGGGGGGGGVKANWIHTEEFAKSAAYQQRIKPDVDTHFSESAAPVTRGEFHPLACSQVVATETQLRRDPNHGVWWYNSFPPLTASVSTMQTAEAKKEPIIFVLAA